MNNRRLLLNLNDEDMKKIPYIYDANENKIYCDDTSYMSNLYQSLSNNNGSDNIKAVNTKALLYYDIMRSVYNQSPRTQKTIGVEL